MVYLDNAATTPMNKKAQKALFDHMENYFANASAVYESGICMRNDLEDARLIIAKCIGAHSDEIYFTSGGTESNNWAMRSKSPVYCSTIEHGSVMNVPNVNATIEVNSDGIVDIEKLKKMDIKDSLVSCMLVNNEIGTIQPIKKIAEICHKNGNIVHTDAVQAMGHIRINVKELGVDMLSASAHKFGGVKGIGFLYVKRGVNIDPLLYGGHQEFGKRAGTENVALAFSMAIALEESYKNMSSDNRKIRAMRNELLRCLLSIDGVHSNGGDDKVVSNINVTIDGVQANDFVAMCDRYGICISSGSACNAGLLKPSHVLKAIGLSDVQAVHSVRITLGVTTDISDIDYCINNMPKIIERLRSCR